MLRDDIAQVGATDPWRLVFWSRYLAIPLLSVVLLTVASDHEERLPVALVLLLGALPATLVLDRWRRRSTRSHIPLLEIDSVAAAVALAIDPTVLPAIVVVMSASVATLAAASGRHGAERSVALSAAVLLITAAYTGPPGAQLLAVYCIIGFLLAIVVGNVADGERSLRASQQVLLEGVDGIVWESTLVGSPRLTIAGNVEAILGVPVDALSPHDGWFHHIHAADQEQAIAALTEIVVGHRDHGILQYRVIARGGRIAHVSDHVRVARNGAGQPERVHGLLVDVTRQRVAEEALSHHRDIVENIHTALLVVKLIDPDDPRSLVLVAANPAAGELIGPRIGDRPDTRLVDAFPILRHGPMPTRLIDTITVGIGFDSEMSLSPEPDSPIYAVHTFPLPDRSAAMALQDVTDRARVQERLRHQALHDALTGLPNRVLLNDRLRKGLSRARRDGEPLAVLILDLNHFKEVNDTLGHHSGDALLSVIARRLRVNLREADTVARLGGDEFAILLTTNAHRTGAEAVAEKVADLVDDPIELDGVTIQVGASIGIALFPDHGDDADALARRADVAMYVAKRAGVPWAVYAPEDDRSSIRRLTLLGELRQAIAHDQLVLHHQPTVDLVTGEVLRSEALLRWRHPEHGLMPPSEFMELAEMSGVIQPLTRWVIQQSIKQVKGLRSHGTDMHVAVNVSARNLYEPDLVDWIGELLQRERFPGERLTLEITESLLMDDPILAREVLTELKGYGISLSIDDFGTGYSSLSYLRDLPIDEIKIDQTFVAAMSGPHGDDTIVRSVIDLGHNLGLAVVAEGVESLETLMRLIELGCDRAQGFLLSHPLPVEELSEVLDSEWFASFADPGGHEVAEIAEA